MSAELLDRIRAGWKDTDNVLKENRRMISELTQSVKGLDKTKSAAVRVQIREGKKRLAEMVKHHRAEKKELNELVRRHTTERKMIKRMLKSVSTTKTRKRCPNGTRKKNGVCSRGAAALTPSAYIADEVGTPATPLLS